MELIGLLVFVAGLSFATIRGAEYAGREIKGAYHRKLDDWNLRWRQGQVRRGTSTSKPAAKRSSRPVRESRTGRKVGAGVATGVMAAYYGGRGFVRGVKAGWPEGRKRAYDRWGQQRAETNEPADAPDHDKRTQDDLSSESTRSVEDTRQWWSGDPSQRRQRRCDRCGEPLRPRHFRKDLSAPGEPVLVNVELYCPRCGNGYDYLWDPDREVRQDWNEAMRQENAEQPRRANGKDSLRNVNGSTTDPAVAGGGTTTDTTTTGGTAMAIETTTGGEIRNMEELLAELGTIETEAGGDLEDARGDAERARQDGDRIERMVASLRQLNLDQETLSEVGALADSASARQAAADQRAAAAEARHSQAKAARDGVQQRHQVMREAVAATPHAAKTEFYQ